MKIAHLPFCYYPDPVGGTEVYVHGLALELQRAGHEVFIVAPAEEAASYQHDGINVYRYRVEASVTDITEMYSADLSVDAAGFLRIMQDESPDILHVHGYTRAVSRKLLSAVRARGIRIIFTYHTPTATCVRGTLMRWGDTSCDGALDAARCAACSLQSHGVPRVAAEIVARLPPRAGRMLGRGPLATGMRMRELVELRHDRIREFLEYADRVIAPSEWVAGVLRTLGVPDHKIVLNRQGTRETTRASQARRAGAVRLAFFGRIDRTKGLHVLLDALASAPDVKLELDVYGIIQGADAYARDIKRRIAADPRVRLLDAIPQDEVRERLTAYDAAVIPSQWLETGPLTVLEAFSAGVPVIGSNLGGIAELVTNGIDGLLVDPRNVAAWTGVLRRVANDAAVLETLANGVRAPRTTSVVAQEMALVYRAVAGND